jgi:hypothetical protein
MQFFKNVHPRCHRYQLKQYPVTSNGEFQATLQSRSFLLVMASIGSISGEGLLLLVAGRPILLTNARICCTPLKKACLHATKACRQVTILINATKNAIGYKM